VGLFGSDPFPFLSSCASWRSGSAGAHSPPGITPSIPRLLAVKHPPHGQGGKACEGQRRGGRRGGEKESHGGRKGGEGGEGGNRKDDKVNGEKGERRGGGSEKRGRRKGRVGGRGGGEGVEGGWTANHRALGKANALTT